jgi:hypothetical protein
MCNPEEDFECKHWKSDGSVNGYCNLKNRRCTTMECNVLICDVSRDCENCTGCIGQSGNRQW